MNLRHILFSILTLAALALTSGCGDKQKEGSIPWSRPADWEGRVPGMGS